MKLTVECLEARLRAPMVSAYGAVARRPLVLVRLEDSDGQVGFGEAAPLPSYDGVTCDAIVGALERCRPLLEGSDGRELMSLVDAVRAAAGLPQAVAAIDLALWDLAGRRDGSPVWRRLGVEDAASVEVNATLASEDARSAADAARGAAAEGFRCVKVKVGRGDDQARVAAVRTAAGEEMAIRLDANGGWSVLEAVAALRALAPAGIELCEEPTGGVEAIAAVARAVPMPVALDESGSVSGALDRRVCAAVCLKIARCGGISGLLAAARRARAAGYEIYVASTLDGPLGIAAALHACAAVRPDRPCGLTTLTMFETPLEGDAGPSEPGPLAPLDGRIAVPRGPGLGVDVAWYRGS